MTEPYTGSIPNVKGRTFDVAYITPEISLVPEIRNNSGGLGVVAGSYICELENKHRHHGFTALAISLYCSHGYQQQVVRTTNNGGKYMDVTYREDEHPDFTEDTGIRLKLILAGRECHIAVRVPRDRNRVHTAVLLLDTDIEENDQDMRMLTRVLYGEQHATAFFSETHEPWHDISWLRVMQAAVLGLGAYELLEHLEHPCPIVHLNESHPVFYLIREMGELQRAGSSREHALSHVRNHAFFTNHTVLASANKSYPHGTVRTVAGNYPGFDEETLRWLNEDPYNLSMTDTAFYLVGPGHANAVSVEHAEIANLKWKGNEIVPITNGVYVPEYQHPEFKNLDRPDQIPDLKRHLKSGAYDVLQERAHDAGHMLKVERQRLLDTVLVTWARRCQSYKRPGLIWHGEESGLLKLLLDWDWISVAWGGYVHPDDTDMMNDWNKYFQRILVMRNVIPVLNYRLDLMRPTLKAAADIWLNTPMYGHEACGTSWMSAMLNCALVVSIADGGVPEAKHVRTFGSSKFGSQPGAWHAQYQYDARTLWQTTLPEIVRLRENDPASLQFLFNAKLEAEEKFSATRMVTDYKRLYGF